MSLSLVNSANLSTHVTGEEHDESFMCVVKLQSENDRLRQMVAELLLKNQILRFGAEGLMTDSSSSNSASGVRG